jgi:uncharacterized damage-inducible protein DinB
MFETPGPRDRTTLFTALEAQGQEIHDAFAGLPLEAFLAPQGEHWSPADHLRHLTKSVRPVARFLGKPKIVTGFLFGRHKGASRTFEDIVELYRRTLQGGAKAGRYAARPRGEGELTDAAWRERTLDHWRQAAADLVRVLPKWNDRALDRYRLPHPLMGKFTLREMLYFTLYHNAHHARRVWERGAF